MKSIKLSILYALFFALFLTCGFCTPLQATVTSETLVFNEQTIDNQHADYPFIVYEDTIYYPVTEAFARAFGITKEFTAEGNLSLTYNGYKMPYRPTLNADNELDTTVQIELYTDPVIVNGRTVDNEEESHPIITYKDIPYLPLDWTYATIEFGWRFMDYGKLGFHVNTQGLAPQLPESTKKHIQSGLNVPGEGQYSGDVYISLHSERYRDGEGDMEYANGHFYSGDFIMDKREGFGYYKWPDNTTYFGTWVDDVRTGFGWEFESDGSIYVGGFSNEQYKGFGVLTKLDHTQLAGIWEGVHFIEEAPLSSPKGFKIRKGRPGTLLFIPHPVLEAEYQHISYALHEEGPWFPYKNPEQKTYDIVVNAEEELKIGGFEPNQTVYFKSIAYIGELASEESKAFSSITSSQEDRILVESESELVSSFIMGDFKGFKEGNLYYLTNGEVWKQTSNDLLMSAVIMPHILIKKDGDDFILSMDNCIIDISVERIEQ